MQVGHEAFWSTAAQLLLVVGGATVVGFSKATRQTVQDKVPRAERLGVVLIGLLVVGNYLWLEYVSLGVLAGIEKDSDSRRSNAVLWMILLMVISAFGPAYFLGYGQTVRDALRVASWWRRRARLAVRRVRHRVRLRERRQRLVD